jgi:hypothetical protein
VASEDGFVESLVETRMDSLSPRTLVGYDDDDSMEYFLYRSEQDAGRYNGGRMEDFLYGGGVRL